VSFDVAAEAYDRFMGRYAEPLAPAFLAWSGVEPGQRVLDVGCGPGALTGELVRRLGADGVQAIDPSAAFVDALQRRLPGVESRLGTAEHLPYPDDAFDAALAQLVVHFMKDPVAGLAEMRRVTQAGGIVAACVWDHGGGRGPVSTFWRAVRDLDPALRDESGLPGSRRGHLAELFRAAGLSDIESTELEVTVSYPSLDDWWEPYTRGVGPAGAYVADLDHLGREVLRQHCAGLLPEPPFDVTVVAWSVKGRV
jgi:SAM-dependent methyltransferase